jgi:hypothetical protein
LTKQQLGTGWLQNRQNRLLFGSIHHHAKKELCVTVPGGWVGLQNLHDAIVVAFQHEMQNNRNAV